jgi:hypothetical protein
MSFTVDVHHHVIPDFYWEASNEDGHAVGGITPPRWSIDGALAYLDAAKIDVAVVSISTRASTSATTRRHGRFPARSMSTSRRMR